MARIRLGVETDLSFLEEMHFEALFWDPGAARPTLAAVREDAEFAKLLAGWWRAGDRFLIAQENGAKAGAAWFRLWTRDVHSYGFVDSQTPELGLAVKRTHRSRGIGRSLLRALIRLAREDGFPALSLSVSPSNHARHLYESEGFRKIGESGTSWTLVLKLQGGVC